MLADVVRILRCPHCGGGLEPVAGTLRCAAGHAFDVARQGYVNLLPRATRLQGDTSAMVAARKSFLAAGHYDFLAAAVASHAAAVDAHGCVVDVGAGTGYYLAAALERTPDRVGIAVDLSKPALRRAARAHPRIGAVAADAWAELPIATGAAAVVLSVFGPRNPDEMRRLLTDRGAVVLTAPTGRHLHELVAELELLTVEEDKQARIDAKLAGELAPVARSTHEQQLELRADEVRAVVGMGPSAWHTDPGALEARLAALEEPTAVTASCVVTVYRPR